MVASDETRDLTMLDCLFLLGYDYAIGALRERLFMKMTPKNPSETAIPVPRVNIGAFTAKSVSTTNID